MRVETFVASLAWPKTIMQLRPSTQPEVETGVYGVLLGDDGTGQG